MAMKIPPDAKVARDRRLTAIKVASVMFERACGRGGLSEKVKATLAEKEVSYAESDLVIARLQPPNKRPVDPVKLYELVKGGQLSVENFLGCVVVTKEKLSRHLAGAQVEALCSVANDGPPSLITEWKSGGILESRDLAQIAQDYWADAD